MAEAKEQEWRWEETDTSGRAAGQPLTDSPVGPRWPWVEERARAEAEERRARGRPRGRNRESRLLRRLQESPNTVRGVFQGGQGRQLGGQPPEGFRGDSVQDNGGHRRRGTRRPQEEDGPEPQTETLIQGPESLEGPQEANKPNAPLPDFQGETCVKFLIDNLGRDKVTFARNGVAERAQKSQRVAVRSPIGTPHDRGATNPGDQDPTTTPEDRMTRGNKTTCFFFLRTKLLKQPALCRRSPSLNSIRKRASRDPAEQSRHRRVELVGMDLPRHTEHVRDGLVL